MKKSTSRKVSASTGVAAPALGSAPNPLDPERWQSYMTANDWLTIYNVIEAVKGRAVEVMQRNLSTTAAAALESTEYYVRDSSRPGDGTRYGPYKTPAEALARIARFRELRAGGPLHGEPWFMLTVRTSVAPAREPNASRQTPTQ